MLDRLFTALDIIELGLALDERVICIANQATSDSTHQYAVAGWGGGGRHKLC